MLNIHFLFLFFFFICLSETLLNAPIRRKHFCGVVAESFETSDNYLYVRYFATKDGINSTFQFLYTAFRKLNGKDCDSNEFNCDDDTCISRDLKCDNYHNCKFKKDEVGCKVNSGQLAFHAMVFT